jgi:geranylgeranyl diphosphate synthase type I
MEMVRLKTGSLFKGCAYIGGLCGNANYEQLRSLEDYAENLGIAFQIVDDILGLFADQGKLGKPVGSDLQAGKKTYLILHAFDHLEKSDKNQLLKLLEKRDKSKEQIEECLVLIKNSGALAKAKDLAKFYVNKAVKSLEIFPKSEARSDLESLANLTVERSF